jgi:nitroreductase
MSDERATDPVLHLIRERVSTERFDPERDLSEEQIRELIDDATCAPSSFNIQHWRFVVVRRPADKERLKAVAYGQSVVTEAAVTFIVLGDTRGEEKLPEIMQVAVERGGMPQRKADAWVRMARKIYADERIARDEAIRSGSLAAMVMMLSAAARGWTTCALSGFDPEQVRREFDIDERYEPVMLLCAGYPAGPDARPKPRLSVDDVLAFDRGRSF